MFAQRFGDKSLTINLVFYFILGGAIFALFGHTGQRGNQNF